MPPSSSNSNLRTLSLSLEKRLTLFSCHPTWHTISQSYNVRFSKFSWQTWKQKTKSRNPCLPHLFPTTYLEGLIKRVLSRSVTIIQHVHLGFMLSQRCPQHHLDRVRCSEHYWRRSFGCLWRGVRKYFVLITNILMLIGTSWWRLDCLFEPLTVLFPWFAKMNSHYSSGGGWEEVSIRRHLRIVLEDLSQRPLQKR